MKSRKLANMHNDLGLTTCSNTKYSGYGAFSNVPLKNPIWATQFDLEGQNCGHSTIGYNWPIYLLVIDNSCWHVPHKLLWEISLLF